MDLTLTLAMAGPGAEWARWITLLGEPFLAVPILVVALLRLHGWQRSQAMLKSLVIIGLVLLVLVQGTKRSLDRPRPAAQIEALETLPGGHLKRHAFPSGHSAFAAYVGGAIAFSAASLPVTVGAVGIAIGVGWSRIAIGAHWFSDVLVGLILGFCLAFLALRRHRGPLQEQSGDLSI